MRHNINSEKKYTIYIKSKNIETFPGNEVNDIITELTDSLFENYEERLQIFNNGSDFVYENVETLGIRFHPIEIKRGSSYIDSPQWLKNKKATINPKNTKDNRCFLYAIVIALNHKEITNHPERIAKLIPFIPKYNWDDIDFPAGRKEISTIQHRNYKDTI